MGKVFGEANFIKFVSTLLSLLVLLSIVGCNVHQKCEKMSSNAVLTLHEDESSNQKITEKEKVILQDGLRSDLYLACENLINQQQIVNQSQAAVEIKTSEAQRKIQMTTQYLKLQTKLFCYIDYQLLRSLMAEQKEQADPNDAIFCDWYYTVSR